jgi:hypothetical protein
MSSDEQMSSIVFLTGHYKIIGKISLMPGVRLADYMNETKDFIVVLDAVVFDRESGEEVYTKPLVNVRRRSIEVIVLEEELW